MRRLSNQFVIYTMSVKNAIAITIEPNEVILIETLDCYSNQIGPNLKTEDQKPGPH